MTQQEKADRFRALHIAPPVLVLPNAWDVASARIFEVAGFPAIATSSAAIAASLGYPDGEVISREEMLDVVARIVQAVDVPVTADVESGYRDPVHTAKAVAATGAVGMNLEDKVAGSSEQLVDQEMQAAIVREIQALRLPIVLNARTDIFLERVGDPHGRPERGVDRLNLFREAGADSLFAPGITDRETIAKLAREVRGPLNILAGLGTPPVKELEVLGVARLTVGSGFFRSALGLVRNAALELRNRGTYEVMLTSQIPYAEVNALLESKSKG